MKYKITNKTDRSIKYAKVIFAPRETKILELKEAYDHNNFHIEKLEEKEKKTIVRR